MMYILHYTTVYSIIMWRGGNERTNETPSSPLSGYLEIHSIIMLLCDAVYALRFAHTHTYHIGGSVGFPLPSPPPRIPIHSFHTRRHIASLAFPYIAMSLLLFALQSFFRIVASQLYASTSTHNIVYSILYRRDCVRYVILVRVLSALTSHKNPRTPHTI